MDFSAVCLDGVLGMGSSNNNKHCRSEMDLETATPRDQEWRSAPAKMARTTESYLMRSASMIADASHNASSELMESAEQQASRLMRSDSVVSPYNKCLTNLPFGGYQYSTSTKPSGMASVGGNGMHGIFGGTRMSSPFTALQWQELEHQALIFKYMMAGVSVPPELLIPIRKNHTLNMFSPLSSPSLGSLRPNLGWSSFHLGFANNADPEPGRCRRTDGKKWRCSRDAVQDQKYCERHMNRGRHRSRKPVEGQTANQAANGAAANNGGAANNSSSATTTSLAAARTVANPANTNASHGAVNGGGGSNLSSLANLRQSQQQHHTGLKNSAFASSMDASNASFQIPLTVDRYLNGMKSDMSGQYFESTNSSLYNENAWRSRIVTPTSKNTNNLISFETRSLVEEAPDFGLGQMNLLPLTNQRNESQQQRPAGIRHFFDDWPTTTTTTTAATTACDHRSAALSWSEIEHLRTAAAASTTTSTSSATQLSISIPSDFSSPTLPNNKLTLSPLKLSTARSDDPLVMDMGLGMGMGLGIESEHHPHDRQRQQHHHHHHNQQHTSWIPITWESSVGGPLAEVLNSTTATPSAKNTSSSALNLMIGDGWDCSSSSPGRGDTSPTGVLQKTFGSLSDSSTGSSPRALKGDSGGLCDNLRTVAFVTAPSQISTT